MNAPRQRRPTIVLVVPLGSDAKAFLVADTFGSELRMLADALGRSHVEREVVEALRRLLLALLVRQEDATPADAGYGRAAA